MIFNAYAEQRENTFGITVVSAGHIFAKNGREIYRPDGRDDWLLFYVAKEEETFFLPKEKVCHAGGFVLFAPGEVQHHKYLGSKTAEFYYIHFRCDALPSDSTLKTAKVYNLPFRRQVCDFFEDIIDEMLKKQPLYERLCVCKLLQLLAEFERGALKKTDGNSQNFDRVARAVQHMNRYYNENLTLSDFADMCNMSKYHFLRTFLQVVGTTPLEYRNNIRLEHAAELLCEERLSASEVGESVGYSSASYFSSAFKKKFGLSPKQYQMKEK